MAILFCMWTLVTEDESLSEFLFLHFFVIVDNIVFISLE